MFVYCCDGEVVVLYDCYCEFIVVEVFVDELCEVIVVFD